MELVNFTEENLSKIHISQFEQFLDKHEVSYLKLNDFIYVNSIIYPVFNCRGYLYWTAIKHGFGDFNKLLTQIYLEYVQGDLTQFHVLFTEVYNEIMSYPINEINEKE